MLTKYILHIGESDYELRDDDLMNWDDVKCSYKREDYGGIVRTFTSQFEFVNNARKMLLDLYLTDRFNAKASVCVYTMNNSWGFDKRFECELDFSTISWEGHVLRINCVDSSLSAMIKANKGTKYEFVIGEDITSDSVLSFDRMPMKESLTYEFTQGEYLDNGDVKATFVKDLLPYIGVVAKEISVNRVINWNDDQTTSQGSYLFKAESDVRVRLQYDLEYRERSSSLCYIHLKIKRRGSPINVETINLATRIVSHWSQPCNSPSELPDTSDLLENTFSQVGEYLWVVKDGEWLNVGKTTAEEFFVLHASGEVSLDLIAGDIVYIDHEGTTTLDSYIVTFKKSQFIFDWLAVGAAVGIEVLTPENAAAALLRKITGGTMATSVSISNFDSRLSNTYLMAAESARGIIGAKFYSSFNEFCDWMSVVFGYVYCIEDIYDETRNEHSKAVCFRHRSELFNPYASISKFGESKNHKYSVDSSYIFSTVTVGYDKKDYESINGRDEFNFSNTYSTGCSLSDKTLSLISKYRADSYGIEFAVQKRGQDTTDSTSDKDVFFLLCTRPSGKLVPDRTAVIENTISDMVFNGAFSPMACVRANAGLIGMQDEELTLKFASSTGNSDIVIDDEPMKSDITLNTPLATCGVLEFETDKAYTENDESKMIKVSDGKFTYQGFLQEADTLYAHANTTKCKIIVKEVLSS